MTSDWPFADPRSVAVFTTANVIERGDPVLLVTHDSEDGAWQFLCGKTSHTRDARIVALEEAVGRDQTLRQVADLPFGWRAKRDYVGGPWTREPRPANESE
jgi:hypothetical protein